MPLIAAAEVPTALVTAGELRGTGSCRLARIAGSDFSRRLGQTHSGAPTIGRYLDRRPGGQGHAG